MKIVELVNQLNNSLPSNEELISFYHRHDLEVTNNEALVEIHNSYIKYDQKVEKSLFDSIIVNKFFERLAFFTFLNHNPVGENLIEFAVFLESDPVYYNTVSGEIFVQKPGFYYLDYPGLVVKAFNSLETFLETLIILEIALRNSMYRKIAVSQEVFESILSINAPSCREFLIFLFDNIKDFS